MHAKLGRAVNYCVSPVMRRNSKLKKTYELLPVPNVNQNSALSLSVARVAILRDRTYYHRLEIRR